MARIAVGGFQHETNTFAPLKAEWRYFVEGQGWPGLTRGADIPPVFAGINIPIAGFIDAATAAGHDLVPLAWAASVPAAHVTVEAFETMAGILEDGLKAALAEGPLDALYLDLHGAMVTEHHEDGEGALLARVRAIVGPDVPIVASLDLHANVTRAMVAHSDLLIAYRTYPHLDMAETGGRVAAALDRLLADGRRPAKALRHLPFLMPLTAQCTMVEPAKGVYEHLAASEGDGVVSLSFTPGFPPADIHECGPAVIAYADDQEAADAAADALAAAITAREGEFLLPLLAPDQAVATAMRQSNSASRTIVLADVQDNSGAGGTSDTTGVLRALIEGGARDAVIGHLVDPEAAAAAHRAGEGASIQLSLGGKMFTAGDPPYVGRFTVEKLGNGEFLCTGPFYGGTRARLGKMALLRAEAGSGSVRVCVASVRMQAADKEMFRHLGVEPAEVKILGLKSTVHFRGDFTDIAEDILVVGAPGAFIDRPEDLPYKNLREGVRLMPLGRPHQMSPT